MLKIDNAPVQYSNNDRLSFATFVGSFVALNRALLILLEQKNGGANAWMNPFVAGALSSFTILFDRSRERRVNIALAISVRVLIFFLSNLYHAKLLPRVRFFQVILFGLQSAQVVNSLFLTPHLLPKSIPRFLYGNSLDWRVYCSVPKELLQESVTAVVAGARLDESVAKCANGSAVFSSDWCRLFHPAGASCTHEMAKKCARQYPIFFKYYLLVYLVVDGVMRRHHWRKRYRFETRQVCLIICSPRSFVHSLIAGAARSALFMDVGFGVTLLSACLMRRMFGRHSLMYPAAAVDRMARVQRVHFVFWQILC